MKTRGQEGKSANEQQFELKYCERCGGLWLRPAGGGQIYCVACARQIAELPPASHQAENTRMPRGPQLSVEDGDYEGDETEIIDLDAAEVWHERIC